VKAGGDVASLAYRTPFYPVVPILAFVLLATSIVAIAFDPNQVAALYFGIPFVALCYGYFWFRYGRSGARNATPLSEEAPTADMVEPVIDVSAARNTATPVEDDAIR
jgi:S-methylmethionine transporter